MTDAFLVYSFIAQVFLWIFAMTQIERARRAAWEIRNREDQLHELFQKTRDYLEKVGAEQKLMSKQLDRIERKNKESR